MRLNKRLTCQLITKFWIFLFDFIFYPLLPNLWIARCFDNPERNLNVFPQWHKCNFAALWESLCCIRYDFWANDFLHTEHGNDFPCTCFSTWRCKSTFHLKDFLHVSQTKEFLEECVSLCLFNVKWKVNNLSHWLHLNNFSSECCFKCLLNRYLLLNDLSQKLHLKDFSFRWLCMWYCRWAKRK